MITKYQQGGNMEQQIVNLVYAAMSGDQQATQQINQIMQAAKSGDKRAVQLASYIQQVAQKLQGSRKARLGAKLNYNQEVICAEDEIPVFMKRGGQICKTCQKLKQGAKKLQKKLQKGGWINKDKKIWNWDSIDRFNRIRNYYQGQTDDISNDDWNYLLSNPELESALHNLYKISKLPNKHITFIKSEQSSVNNMPKGADPDKYIASVPDSTNNYKGRLGVGQFQMLPTQQQKSKKGLTYQQVNNRKQNFHNWQRVAQKRGYATGTFIPYMHKNGFAYDWDKGTWYNPKANIYLYSATDGTVMQYINGNYVPYNGIQRHYK